MRYVIRSAEYQYSSGTPKFYFPSKHQTVTKACFYCPGVSAPALCAIASSTSIGMNLDKDAVSLLRSFYTSNGLDGEVGELRLAAELQRRRSFIVEISKRMYS
jgi:hypothetical protein